MPRIIAQGRHDGRRVGHLLTFVVTSIDLLCQSGENLAGRIAFVELTPLAALEIGQGWADLKRLELRGGVADQMPTSANAWWNRSSAMSVTVA